MGAAMPPDPTATEPTLSTDPGAPAPADDRRPTGRRGTAAGLLDRVAGASVESWVTFAIVAACVVFTLVQLQPHLILRNTTPNGGDMGAHVWAPAYLRDHLLTDGRLTGWTNDWYAGFPALRFYMVPPMLAIVLLDVVLPYGVAFKLVAVSGVLALPVACWAFARLAGLRFPSPALFAVGATVFLFNREYSIWGGNIPSTLAGEFAFSISLSLAMVYLGLVANGLRTGRHRGWAALTVALCALTHVIPLIFAIVGTFVLLAFLPSKRGLVWVATVAPVGALLAAWWLLPFWWQRAYLNDMGWNKTQPLPGTPFWEQVGFYLTNAFPRSYRWAANLAFAGVVIAAFRRVRVAYALTALVLLGVVAFVVVPQGRLWNARLLPFVYLLTFLMAAFAVGEGLRAVASTVRERHAVTWRVGGAAVATACAFVLVALPLRALPFGQLHHDGTYGWVEPFRTADSSYVPGWARWNFRGYEGKDAWPEYEDVLLTMGNLGERNGCGRAMWEYDRELDRYGTPMALMLLPFWTDGCIASMEGLYFESASTTPYHFLNQSALSAAPSRAQRDLPYRDFDVDLGVRQLQMMGVRYYMALSDRAITAADAHPSLTEVARSGPWVVYEVADAPLVEPVANLPAVFADPPDRNHEWIEATADWFQAPAYWSVLLAADGPADWPRTPGYDASPAIPVDAVEVSNVVLEDDRIAFDVSEPGVPILVKVSYFPNWSASGAEGPYRVSPNFMVVVPTDTHVELRYGRAPVEVAGIGLTALGLVGLVLLVRAGPLPAPRPDDLVDDEPGDGPVGDRPLDGRAVDGGALVADVTTVDAPARPHGDAAADPDL